MFKSVLNKQITLYTYENRKDVSLILYWLRVGLGFGFGIKSMLWFGVDHESNLLQVLYLDSVSQETLGFGQQ